MVTQAIRAFIDIWGRRWYIFLTASFGDPQSRCVALPHPFGVTFF